MTLLRERLPDLCGGRGSDGGGVGRSAAGGGSGGRPAGRHRADRRRLPASCWPAPDQVLAHGTAGRPGSVAASWAVAFDRLAADARRVAVVDVAGVAGPGTGAVDPVHRAPRPAARAAGRDRRPTRSRWPPLTAMLRRRGLARVTAGSVQLHRVPAALLRARTAHRSAGLGGRPSRCGCCMPPRPPDAWNNPPVWPAWRPLLPHVLAAVDPARPLDEVAAEVTWLLAGPATIPADRAASRAPRASVVRRAYTLNRDRLGDDHPDDPDSANNLALVLRELGDHQQARALDEDTLAPRRRVLGDDHPDTLTSANNLAIDLRALGEHQRARDSDEDTLARRRRVLGDDHPDTLTSASNLAADLAALGEHEQARGPRRGHPRPPPPGPGRRPPRHPHLGQQPRRRAGELGEHQQARGPRRGHPRPPPPRPRRRPPRHPDLGQQPRRRPWPRWASTSRPARCRGHPHPPPPHPRRRPPRHPPLGQQPRRQPAAALGERQQARNLEQDTRDRRGS